MHGIQPGATCESDKSNERRDDKFRGQCDSTFAICRRSVRAHLLCESSFNINYNSLQTSLTKRLSHGLEFLGSYTWSRNLDQTSGSSGSGLFETHLVTNDQNNFSQAYGPTDFDRTNRAVVSFVYNPSIQQPHANSSAVPAPRLADFRLSLWRRAARPSQYSTTAPALFTAITHSKIVHSFQRSCKPTTSGSLYTRVVGRYLNPAAFTSAPEAPYGTGPADTDFGNSGEGLVRGPGPEKHRHGDGA